MKYLYSQPVFDTTNNYLFKGGESLSATESVDTHQESVDKALEHNPYHDFDDFNQLLPNLSNLPSKQQQEFYDKILQDVTSKSMDTQVSGMDGHNYISVPELNDYVDQLDTEIQQVLSVKNLTETQFNIQKTVDDVIKKITEKDLNVEWNDDEAFYLNSDGDLMINKNWSTRNEVLYPAANFEGLKTSPADVVMYLNSHREEIKAKLETPAPQKAEEKAEDVSPTPQKTPEKKEAVISTEEKGVMNDAFNESGIKDLPANYEQLSAKGARKEDGIRYVGKRIKNNAEYDAKTMRAPQAGAFWYYPDQPDGQNFGYTDAEGTLHAFVDKSTAQNGIVESIFGNATNTLASVEVEAESNATRARNQANETFLAKLKMSDVSTLGVDLSKAENDYDKVVKVQEKLIANGYTVSSNGQPDGWAGTKTEQALSDFRSSELAQAATPSIQTIPVRQTEALPKVSTDDLASNVVISDELRSPAPQVMEISEEEHARGLETGAQEIAEGMALEDTDITKEELKDQGYSNRDIRKMKRKADRIQDAQEGYASAVEIQNGKHSEYEYDKAMKKLQRAGMEKDEATALLNDVERDFRTAQTEKRAKNTESVVDKASDDINNAPYA